MDFSPSPDSDDNSGYYRNRNRRDDRDRGNRGRSKERYRSNSHYSRSRSRSYSKERYPPRQRSPGERDLYRDVVDQDYVENNWERDRHRHRSRDRDRDRDRRSRDRDRNRDRRDKGGKRGYSPNSMDDGETYETDNESFYQQKPNNKIIIRGLAPQITEADINSDLIQSGLQAIRVRLIRKKKTGESRGFAFVEFRTEEEATRWICYKQGVLVVNGHHAVMQYTFSVPSECRSKDKSATDWYCAKCCAFNFKRRENCFKCYASREESEIGGEGSDEMSNILTKKIMFRNLDVLTNEETVLCVMQESIPDMVSKIAKILICRDPLTSISRGICYLHFDNLVDSMNTHNALKALTSPLKIDNREVLISYCMDTENRNLVKHPSKGNSNSNSGNHGNNNQNSGHGNNHGHSGHHGYQEAPATGGNANNAFSNAYQQYTVADVPRLAEYSASVYASNPAEHDHYLQYYKNYYMTQITQGQTGNPPAVGQLGETANNGAAVAQSAIARKQSGKARQDTTMAGVIGPVNQPSQSANRLPNGVDGRKYPPPDVSVYQYDETSGFYYDPSTGLYYDSHSQYYYNNETSSYLYWDPEGSTYVSAPSAATTAGATAAPTFAISATSHEAVAAATALAAACDSATGNDGKPEKPKAKEQSQDKVKVAKKIVKDMEKWAKQLNQKKDYSVVQPSAKVEEATLFSSLGPSKVCLEPAVGYADVGFSLLEKKERTQAISSYLMSQASKSSAGAAGAATATSVPSSASAAVPPPAAAAAQPPPAYGSDSDNDPNDDGGLRERDFVDFDKLTCLLCKRAFQSHEILNKHLKMSSLHKENLQKLNMQRGSGGTSSDGGGNLNNIPYRDRAKERRQKYGEDEAPPVNRSKERFQRELEKQAQSSYQQTASVSVPIGQNNVGNKLLQKMGWSEGQGLGRANQGRVNIIEAESRVANVGLGIKAAATPYGRTADDYKTYIKKMMKSRYEQVDVKD